MKVTAADKLGQGREGWGMMTMFEVVCQGGRYANVQLLEGQGETCTRIKAVRSEWLQVPDIRIVVFI